MVINLRPRFDRISIDFGTCGVGERPVRDAPVRVALVLEAIQFFGGSPDHLRGNEYRSAASARPDRPSGST